MGMLSFCTRRYTDPNCVLTFQAPGAFGQEVRLTDLEAMNVQTQGVHEQLGDYWLYLYASQGEAYLLVQYHHGNQGLMAPPIRLKSFNRVMVQKLSDVERTLTFYLGESVTWCFPYRVVSGQSETELSRPFLDIDEEAQDFGLFIVGLARDRARMLDFIDYQDPTNDVVALLFADQHA